ncbi:MAG: hypothetical protein KDI17_11355 [Halioglobus sp.]|nr:hypothetical protein [Halioglobus sp.]
MSTAPSATGASALRTIAVIVAFAISLIAPTGVAAPGTRIPISAGLATGIAADMFPVTVSLGNGKLFLSEPVALFLDEERVGLQVRVQAYDHRPTQGVAISETGRAIVSGVPGYDSSQRQILLRAPKIEKLEFERSSATTQRFLNEIDSAWRAQVTDPLRADIPPHPYLLPFRNNIQDLAYDGSNIIITLSY